MEEHIYGLHCENDPDTIIYVGRSNDPHRRLGEHIGDSKTKQTKKSKVLKALIEQGEKISYRILEAVDLSTPSSAEDLWKTNLEADGHPLLNSKSGDTDRYAPTLLDVDRKPWTADLFHNADWQKNDEWSKSAHTAWIRGILFTRHGKRKLKFKHPDYGEWNVEGLTWERKCENAALILEPDTPEHRGWMEQFRQARNIKPGQFQ